MLRQPFVNKWVTVSISEEEDLTRKFKNNKGTLMRRMNRIRNTFMNSTYTMCDEDERELRDVENTLSVYFENSILYEDIEKINKIIGMALNTNRDVVVEYWGQSEHLKILDTKR
jgi:hypothetical protein